MAQCRCSAVYAVVSMLVGVFGLMPTTQPDNSEWGVLVNDDTCSTAGGRCSLKLLQKNVHQEARGLKSAKSEQSSPQRREVQSLHLKAKSSPQQDEAGGWNPHKMEHWVPPPRHPALSSHEDTWQKQLFTFLQSAMDVKEISKWRESAQRTSGCLLWLRIVFVVVEFAVLLSVSLWARIAASQSSGSALLANGRQGVRHYQRRQHPAQVQYHGDAGQRVPLGEEKPYEPKLSEGCDEAAKATTAPTQEADTTKITNK